MYGLVTDALDRYGRLSAKQLGAGSSGRSREVLPERTERRASGDNEHPSPHDASQDPKAVVARADETVLSAAGHESGELVEQSRRR